MSKKQKPKDLGGRPRKPVDQLRRMLSIRFEPADIARWQRCASESGQTLTRWIEQACRRRAGKG